MQEEVARVLCWHAATGHHKKPEHRICNFCDSVQERNLNCELWPTFVVEAEAAILAVRRRYLFTPRKGPVR